MIRFCGALAVTVFFSLPALAQSASGNIQTADTPRLSNGKPDFSGVWDHPRVADVTRSANTCGSGSQGCKQEGSGELLFTALGKAIWDDVEPRFDYYGHCLPWGYTRAWQVEYPVEIVQNTKRLAILFESRSRYGIAARNRFEPGSPLAAEDMPEESEKIEITRQQLLAIIDEALKVRGVY